MTVLVMTFVTPNVMLVIKVLNEVGPLGSMSQSRIRHRTWPKNGSTRGADTLGDSAGSRWAFDKTTMKSRFGRGSPPSSLIGMTMVLLISKSSKINVPLTGV